MAYREPRDREMGPPGAELLRVPAHSNEYAAYVIVALLALLLAGLVVLFHLEGRDPAVQSPLVVLAVLAATVPVGLWLLYKTFVYARKGRLLDFGEESLVISRQWMFGRPITIPYHRVTRIESPRNAHVLHFDDGSEVRLSVFTAPGHWTMAGLKLRVGCACARRGEHEEALAHYESAEYHFYPSLAARKAKHHEALGDFDEALECLMMGVVEHEQAFGGDSRQAALLRARLDDFKRAHPEAESTWSFEEFRERARERRETYSKYHPPQMRDVW